MKLNKVIFFILLFFASSAFSQVDFLQWQNPQSSNFQILSHLGTQFKVNLEELLENEFTKKIEVRTALELRAALDKAKGGEVILLRRSIRNEPFKYYRNKSLKPFKKRVYLVGMLDNGQAPFLDSAVWANIQNITISHLRVNRKNVHVPKEGFKREYAWQAREVKNFRISNVKFYGSDDGLQLLAKGSTRGVFNDPTGLFVKDSENVIIDRNLFENLFHAVEFQNIKKFKAISNRSDKITSDMFSGGGLNGGLFDSNLSLTKTPVYYKFKGRKHYIHSDVIQLYTRGVNKSSYNVTIRNNIVLAGNSPVKNKLSAGWQCFFTRDEVGDRSRSHSTEFKNIRIYNNLCMSNQHHGITMSRGSGNLVSGNVILELGTGDSNITAGLRIHDQRNTKVVDNLAKNVIIDETSERNCGPDILNNIEKGADDTVVKFFKRKYVQAKKILIQRRDYVDEVNPEDEEVLRPRNKVTKPEEVLDFRKMHLVPFRK